jgi:putative ABC transport system ATP-binding protein
VSPRAEPFIVVDQVSRRFRAADGEVVVALDAVSAEIATGRLTVIAGHSGSGKSTLLGLVGALDRPDEGDVFVDGHSLAMRSRRERRRWRRDRVGIVLPLPSDNLSQRFDARGNLEWAARLRRTATTSVATSATTSVATSATTSATVDQELLARLGVLDVLGHAVHELSMGQQMRLAFACATIGRPPLVIADEPTASLDAEAGGSVIDALTTLAGAGAALVVATHDEAVIDAADHVVRLEDGRRIA